MTASAGPGESTGSRPVGVWIGVDVGSVRVGVARSDPRGVLAVPVTTLRRDRSGADIEALAALVAEYEAVGVVVGLPRTLAGREGAAVDAAREFGGRLRQRLREVPVSYADERMTTVVAQRNLLTSGVRGRSQRAMIDQAAAVAILQSFLDGGCRADDLSGGL
jgi:putative Holliday junction resolvase